MMDLPLAEAQAQMLARWKARRRKAHVACLPNQPKRPRGRPRLERDPLSSFRKVPGHRRPGNPRWAIRQYELDHEVRPTAWELFLADKPSPDMIEAWCRRYRNSKYIPEPILAALDIRVNVEAIQ